jgi:mono/diheme cytochrome c family protein
VAGRRRSKSDFPWGDVMTVGVIVVLIAGFIGGGLGWILRGGGSSSTASSTAASTTGPAATSTTAASTSGSATPVSATVAEGGHYFVQFACAQCHGIGGQGGVSSYVPALSSVGKTLTVSQLTSIIEHGLGESANPKQPYMPVWHGVISNRQISSLVAYIRAGLPPVAGAVPQTVPTDQGDVVAGGALYVRYGCINCHGPNGLGGVPNPQSPDKTIPPLSGLSFRSEFNTPAKIKAVIQSGSVIGRAPIVSMPHWGGILTDQQLNQLVAYLHTLK